MNEELQEAVFEEVFQSPPSGNVVEKQNAAKHLQPAPLMKIGLGRDKYMQVVELDLDAKPEEVGEKNRMLYSCKHNNPCQGYHLERTYYAAYRPALFILCYKYDYCIELSCPMHFYWNSSLATCVDAEEIQEVPDYKVSEEAKELTSIRTRFY
ncbi:hypothetical protein HELRODRAFT_171654 [Helobdella robusta]|uniref:Chitin-binding type-2 domain-containing protein n=1 Tax=Helobdella robusta TaxID=6412 RepID=T1F4I7_HELRO|nr:hypothetical protein HELRODRAFT_171654 [Helobdella robusta]ESO05291.1 hypothetical protein HELRODRAFT_171654 [Helobdella robusta]